MNQPVLEIIKRLTRLATEAKQLGLTTIPIDPENMLMVLGVMPDSSADFSADLPDAYGRLQPAFRLPKRECLILQERGLLEKRTRPSSSGTAKSFWSITEKGLAFGKNISSPENPRETQPHWFSAKGEELLRVMGVLE